jgi:probable addiction module antidote protein
MRTFKEALHEDLKNPLEAKSYLEVALENYEEDKDVEAFLMALRDVAEAQGGISKLAERTHLNRQNLYRALSNRGNPKLETIGTILHGLGFKLAIQSLNKSSIHVNH